MPKPRTLLIGPMLSAGLLEPEHREMNPRYVAYATANKRTPDAQLAHDEHAWPGGKMTGFILWIGERWKTFADARGPEVVARLARGCLQADDHDAFTAWLLAPSSEP